MEPTPQPAISPANSHAETLQLQQPPNAEKPSAQAASKYTVSSNVTVKSLSQPSSSPTRPPPPSLPKPPSPWRIWRLEILFCIISLGSFISVIAVLRTYEGRSLPDLPMRVTLNTVVAFLTTLTKASFMTFLSESISQLKWNAFHTYPGRPLRDFDLMDRASRGVAGSFSLLRRLKWRHLTSVAAIITIVSIVTTPVTQQMISYPSRRVPSSHAVSVPYTREWSYIFDRLYNTDLARAVTTGMTTDVDDPIEQVRPNCPTANCTFPSYTSLAVCVQNAEITHLLNITKIENSQPEDWFGAIAYTAVGLTEPRTAYNVSLPNGFHVVTPSPFTAVQRVGRQPIAFADDRDASNYTALAHVFVIYANEGNVTDPAYKPTSAEPGAMWEFRAVETLFHVCVNSYQTEVVAGVPSTRIVSSSYAPLLSAEGNQPVPKVHCNTTFEYEARAFGSCPPEEIAAKGKTTLRDPDDPARGFTLERSRAASMSQVLQISLSQDIVYTGEWGTPMMFSGTEAVAFLTAVYGRNFNISKQEDHMARLERFHNNTAYSLTNYIRTSTSNRQDLLGTAWEEETYVSVQWGWSVWLIVELLASYLLLAATIISTYRKKVPAWKSSVLAVVAAPTAEIQSAVGPMQDPREGEKNASSVLARLDRGRLDVVE